MLLRRTLIASTAALAAGCGGLDIPFPTLGAPEITPLSWVSRPHTGLSAGPVIAQFEEMLRRVERNLQADTDSPFGPTQGRYSLELQYFEHYAGSYSDPDAEEFRKPEFLAAWLEEIEADLVTVWHDEARVLGEMGALLPLDQFGGPGGVDFEKEFYAPVLDLFRENGTLYALPADAFPLMLYYDADYFAQMGVAPPDDTWNWDILVESALKLTQREEDGTVSRWGLAAHSQSSIWWALWQNAAELADTLTSQCRLQEPAGIAALEFFRALVHTHGVSPAVYGSDLWELLDDPASSPPAMLYSIIPPGYSRFDYRRAELPRGKVRSVPAHTDVGIAVVAKTAKAGTAYTALRGLLRAMQPYVNAPAEREIMARFGEIRPDLEPDEVMAIRKSMEHGRAEPHDPAQSRAVFRVADALVRGDEVVSAVNQACSILYENQGT